MFLYFLKMKFAQEIVPSVVAGNNYMVIHHIVCYVNEKAGSVKNVICQSHYRVIQKRTLCAQLVLNVIF